MPEPVLTIRPSVPQLSATGWLDMKAAAARWGFTGVNPDAAMRHRVRWEGWLASGLARELAQAKGKAILQVHETAHARLARAKSHEQVVASWSGRHLTDPQRKIVLARQAIVEACDRFIGLHLDRLGRTAAIVEFSRTAQIGGKPVSWRTLYNWIAAYQNDGLSGLEDGRAITKRASAASQFFLWTRELYFTQERISKRWAWKLACKQAAELGVECENYIATARYLRNVERTDKAMAILMREGPKAHNDKAAPFIERDYGRLATNQLWNGDTCTFDVAVDVGGGKIARPFVTAWQDTASRKIVGWHVHVGAPNSDHVNLSLRHAIEPSGCDCGVPEEVLIDNGKHYDSYELQGQTKWERHRTKLTHDDVALGGIFRGIGVKVTHCRPYRGQSKPIESWFGTMHDQFCRMFETYTGESPMRKPEQLIENIKAGLAPSLDDFIGQFSLYVDGFNAAHEHTGDGMNGRTPQQVFLDKLGTKRTVNAELLDILLLPSRRVKVGRNGVTLDGITYGRNVCIEHKLLGQEVIIRFNPRRSGEVSLWTAEDSYIAIGPANERLHFRATREDVRAATKEMKRLTDVRQQYHEVRGKLSMSKSELASKLAAERASKLAAIYPTDPNPSSVRPIQSPLAQGAKEYQQAIERRSLRLAAGAETSSLLGNGYQPQPTHEAGSSSLLGDITTYLTIRPGDAHE